MKKAKILTPVLIRKWQATQSDVLTCHYPIKKQSYLETVISEQNELFCFLPRLARCDPDQAVFLCHS